MTNPKHAADCRSRDELVAAVLAGEEPGWLLFWGHRPPKGGGVGPGCLSQWWPARFVVDGTAYRSAEHWMMARKARLFGDKDMAEQIVAAPNPSEAKKLGRQVRGFDEPMWNRERFELVVQGNMAKFGQHSDLRAYLLATGRSVLVEASPTDRVWGVGLGASNELATDPQRWRGENLLGFALMEARSRLAAMAGSATQ